MHGPGGVGGRCEFRGVILARPVRTVLLAVVGALTAGLGSCGFEPEDEPVPLFDLGAIPAFSLSEREGGSLGLDDLRGHVWLASFVYTRCGGPCPLITARMATLEDELPDDVRLVSISVDPGWDTPTVLAEYADSWGADPQRWFFLTGEGDEIRDLVRDGFRLALAETEGPPTDFITHSTRIAVVDRSGVLRGAFDSSDADALRRLRRAVARLRSEGSP